MQFLSAAACKARSVKQHAFHGASVMIVSRSMGGDTFCFTPLGQRISTLSTLVAFPSPNVTGNSDWER
jgi:hypothetical protein